MVFTALRYGVSIVIVVYCYRCDSLVWHCPIVLLSCFVPAYLSVAQCCGCAASLATSSPASYKRTTTGFASPFGYEKSSIVTQNQFPEWNEKIRMELPEQLAESYENLYIHVKLWDWDFMKSDDMIGTRF